MGTIIGNGIRFEEFFLDHLAATGTFDTQNDLLARARLCLEVISGRDSVGYFVEGIPPECRRRPIPKHCLVAKGISVDATLTTINALAANGFLPPDSRRYWNTLCQSFSFIEIVPSVFNEITRTHKSWTAQSALEVLNRTFEAVTGVAQPAPDGEGKWAEHCRTYPNDPMCWIGSLTFTSPAARQLAQGLLVTAALHQYELLKDVQVRSIYNVSYRAMTARQGFSDLDLRSGDVIIDGLSLDPKQKAAIATSLAATQVGVVDPESPWADICEGSDAPRICQYVRAFPVAAKFTTQLINHGSWDKQPALQAWVQLENDLETALQFERLAQTGFAETGVPTEEVMATS